MTPRFWSGRKSWRWGFQYRILYNISYILHYILKEIFISYNIYRLKAVLVISGLVKSWNTLHLVWTIPPFENALKYPFQALEKMLPENATSPAEPSPNPAPYKKTKVTEKPVTPTTGTGTPSPAKDDPYAFQSPQPKQLFAGNGADEMHLMTQRSHDSEDEDFPDPELEKATHHNSYLKSNRFLHFSNELFCFSNWSFQVGDAILFPPSDPVSYGQPPTQLIHCLLFHLRCLEVWTNFTSARLVILRQKNQRSSVGVTLVAMGRIYQLSKIRFLPFKADWIK